jgi:hypothetical protein
MTEPQPTPAETRQRRRRFVLSLLPLVALLLTGGIVFGDEGGLLGLLGLMAVAQGIGLAVALVTLALGHNPLSKD